MASKDTEKKFLLRVDAGTMAKLEAWAAQEFRSVNGQLQWIIADALRRYHRMGAEPPAEFRSGCDDDANES